MCKSIFTAAHCQKQVIITVDSYTRTRICIRCANKLAKANSIIRYENEKKDSNYNFMLSLNQSTIT